VKNLKLRDATVIDNNDEKQAGRVQVRILPEHRDVDEGLLPWAYPYNISRFGAMADVGTMNIPEIDSIVKVIVLDAEYHQIFYLPFGSTILDRLPREFFDNNLDVDGVIDTPEYPQPHFSVTPDGTLFFNNTDTGEMGIQSSTGLYVVVDKEGSLHVRYGKTVLIHDKDDKVSLELNVDDDKITMKAKSIVIDTDAIEVGGAGDSVALFTPLEKIINELLEHIHVAPTGPTTPASDSSMVPLSGKLASDVPQMESGIISTD